MSDHGAGLHAEEERSEHLRQVAEQLRHRVEPARPSWSARPAAKAATQPAENLAGVLGPERQHRSHGGRQLLEQGLPVVECAQRPLAGGHRSGGEQPTGRHGHAGSLSHVQLGHPQQLLDPDPDGWVDVALGLAGGSGPLRHLAGDLPVDRPLACQQTGQIAHQVLERAAAGRHSPSKRSDRTHRQAGFGSLTVATPIEAS